MKKSLIIGLNLLTTIAIVSVPLITKDNIEETQGTYGLFLSFMFRYRFWIVIPCATINVLVSSGVLIIRSSKEKARLRRRLMEHMRDEVFRGEENRFRITIFRDAGWRWAWYTTKRFWAWFGTRDKRQYPLWGQFIFVWERIGTEHKKSNTFFFYSPQTERYCEGLAALVRQTNKHQIVDNLPNIEGVDLDKINITSKRQETKHVLEYMKAVKLREPFGLYTLKRLNRRARHFCATPVYKRGVGPVGVLMVDSWLDKSPFEDREHIRREMEKYTALLGEVM